jgi:NitT/TauT family transport system substrate-binding protein
MRHAHLRLLAAVGLLLLLPISACSSSGASSTPSGSGPEKTHITVGVLPIPDAAPLFIAIHRGFFKQQGLTVTPEIITNTPSSTPKLLAGTMDFSALNYVSTFEIEETGVKFAIVADDSQSAPDYFDIMVPKGSPITSPVDLKGKTLAVPAPNAIGTLGVDSVLKPYGIVQSQVKFAYIPFPNMLAALKTKQIDAAVEVEPFITQMESMIGAHALADIMSGATANFPIGGWGTVQQYVKKYPRTVAAFQRAIEKGQQVAASSRKAVEQILPTYSKIPPQVASVMSMPVFPTALSAIRLQRAADLMLQYRLIHQHLDVATMVLPAPKK